MKISELPELERTHLTRARELAVLLFQQREALISLAIISTEDKELFYESSGPSWDSASDAVIEAKRTFSNFVRATSVIYEALAVTLCTEAWIVRLSSNEERKNFNAWRRENPGASFGDYPKRREVLMLGLESELGRALWNVEIHRAGVDQTPWLDPVSDDDELEWVSRDSAEWNNITGAMTNLYIPAKYRTELIKRASQLFLDEAGTEIQEIKPDPDYKPPANPHAN